MRFGPTTFEQTGICNDLASKIRLQVISAVDDPLVCQDKCKDNYSSFEYNPNTNKCQMFGQNEIWLSENRRSIDFYNCVKGEVFQKDELMKVYVDVDSANNTHIYHTYDMSENLEAHCDPVTPDSFDQVLQVLGDKNCIEFPRYFNSSS